MHIKGFTMYELTTNRLKTLMLGSEAYRYEDRYTVDNIDHTDNARVHISNLRADFGIYKDNIVNLDGNVTFTRDDGLIYNTQKARYNKKNALFVTDTDYILYQGADVIRGSYVEHNNISGKIYSKNVDAVYRLKENTKGD